MNRILVRVWRWLAGFSRPSSTANRAAFARRGESVDTLTIRDATAADIPALAALHVETWNATYAPMLMNGPNVAVREAQWREAFNRQDGSWFCLVVETRDGRMVGFAKARLSDHPEFGGELNKVYLRTEYQRLGLGRRLVRLVACRLLDIGITSMWLSGDARNPSCRAWVAMGAEKLDDDPGIGNYGWRDLRALISSASSGHCHND